MIIEIAIALVLVFFAYITLIQWQKYKMTILKRRLEIEMRREIKKSEK